MKDVLNLDDYPSLKKAFSDNTKRNYKNSNVNNNDKATTDDLDQDIINSHPEINEISNDKEKQKEMINVLKNYIDNLGKDFKVKQQKLQEVGFEKLKLSSALDLVSDRKIEKCEKYSNINLLCEKEKELLYSINSNSSTSNIGNSNKNKIENSDYFNISNYYSSWKQQQEKEFNIIEQSFTSSTKQQKANFDEKVHIYRESILSVMFNKNPTFKSVYYYFICIFIWLRCWLFAKDINEKGFYHNTSYIMDLVFDFTKTWYYLLFIYSYGYLVVPIIQMLKYYISSNNFNKENKNKIPYKVFFISYVIYWFGIYIITSYFVLQYEEMPTVSSIIVGCELARVSLKMHSYMREKVLYGFSELHEEYINFKPKSMKEAITPSNNTINDKNDKNTNRNINNNPNSHPDIKILSFKEELKRFTFFFFCPSLIYRDSYPRIQHIRWKYLFANIFNFLSCIMFLYILLKYNIEPFMNNFTVSKYFSLIQFIYDSLSLALPGICFLVVGFFMFLHSWMNIFAEILRYGDRRFYEDWWTSTNFEVYYRKWNMVVHEWLYYYIYNDVIRFSLGRINRNYAKYCVFFISVVIHEVVVMYYIKFFYPVLSLFFGGPGILFTYIKTKNKKFNTMIWLKLYLGLGLIMALLLREFTARRKFEGIELISSCHHIIPRSILIYFECYTNKIR